MQNSGAKSIELIDGKIAQFSRIKKQISTQNVFDDNFMRVCDETGTLLADLFSKEEKAKFLEWALLSPWEIDDFRRSLSYASDSRKRFFTEKYKHHLERTITLLNSFKDIIIYGDILQASIAASPPEMNDPLSSFRNLQTGTQIGNYIVTKKLGVGGIGAVYLARHQFLNQVVAVKIHDFSPQINTLVLLFFGHLTIYHNLATPTLFIFIIMVSTMVEHIKLWNI